MNLASCARWSAETAGRKGLLETVQGCPTPKYIPYSVNGAKFVSVVRGQGERQQPMDVEANSHGKIVGMFIIKAKVTAHIACVPSLMSQELTTIFHTEVASTGCRREEQEGDTGSLGTRTHLPSRRRSQCVEASLRPVL